MQTELRDETIVLRSVGEADAESLLPAYNGDQAFSALNGEEEMTLEAARADILEGLAMPGGRIWRIERISDGMVLGVASTALVPPPHNGWIALLEIRAEYQRQGYGTAAADLIEAALFAESEVTRLGLGVMVQNAKALAFWEGRGYARGLKRRDNHGNEIYTMRKDRPDRAAALEDQATLTKSQFGKAAAAYGASLTHARGNDLSQLANLAALAPVTGIALDIATGGGHAAYAIAPYIARVVASDLTPAMLEEVARGAAARGLENITTVLADVHALPFDDAHFDLVLCRIAPHHFAALPLAMREMTRVTRPGGMVIIIDSVVPEDPELDRFLNTVERMRDPSHGRSLTEAEWRELFMDSGLSVFEVERFPITHPYADWVARAQVSEARQGPLEAAFLEASAAAKGHYKIMVEDGHVISYTDEKLLIAGRKAER